MYAPFGERPDADEEGAAAAASGSPEERTPPPPAARARPLASALAAGLLLGGALWARRGPATGAHSDALGERALLASSPDLRANVTEGALCSNWRALMMADRAASTSDECQAECSQLAGCRAFMHRPGDCSEGLAPRGGPCVLLAAGPCDLAPTACWNVHVAPSPRPLGWYLSSRQTSCWNGEQATIRSSREGSAQECGSRCQLEDGCTGFGFQPAACVEEDGGGQGACILYTGECSMKFSICYDFYQMGAEPIVTVGSGKLRGLELGGVAGFQGVPYARPPTSELRFAPPEPADAWGSDLLDATGTRVAKKCLQAFPEWFGLDPEDLAEDCLYLNVFAPVHSLGRDALLPVWVHFHGGSFAGGMLHSMWNITRLAGVVVVEPQYRLSALGFFASKAPPSNLGIEDQRLALRWVQQNARAFGGDPDHVMILGTSAGGASVAAHLVMPESAGLFSSASMESPGGHQGWMGAGQRINDDFLPASLLMSNSRRLAEQLGCAGPEDMECLRQAPAEKLISIAREMRFAPALAAEGEFPLALIRRGKWQKVPVIIGGNSCEQCGDARSILGPPSAQVSQDDFHSALERWFGESDSISADQLQDWYRDRVADEGTWRAFARIVGDSGHSCNAALTSEALRATSPKVWRYMFDLLDPKEGDMPGALHTSEVQWLLAKRSGTPAQEALTRAMASWWTSLAVNGDPNVGSISNLTWPEHRAEEPLVLFLDEKPHVGSSPDTVLEECSHWRRFLGWGEDIAE